MAVLLPPRIHYFFFFPFDFTFFFAAIISPSNRSHHVFIIPLSHLRQIEVFGTFYCIVNLIIYIADKILSPQMQIIFDFHCSGNSINFQCGQISLEFCSCIVNLIIYNSRQIFAKIRLMFSHSLPFENFRHWKNLRG